MISAENDGDVILSVSAWTENLRKQKIRLSLKFLS